MSLKTKIKIWLWRHRLYNKCPLCGWKMVETKFPNGNYTKVCPNCDFGGFECGMEENA